MNNVENLVDKYQELRGERAPYEQKWREILELVRLNAQDFTGSKPRRQTTNIYDGTAPEALCELASGLQSYLTNPSDRWFTLALEGDKDFDDEEGLLWLDKVSDIMFGEFSSPRTSFTTSIHEVYLDIGAFGMGILNSEISDGHLLYRSFSLVDCYFEENKDGQIDTCFRELRLTKRKLLEMFGDAVPSKVQQQASGMIYTVLHAVVPRSVRDQMKLNPLNMAWGSYWILMTNDGKPIFLRESGYKSFPYHVPRWLKISAETYGYGPAENCLPDIKMLNAMEKTLIKAGAKVVDPPLQVPDDGFLLPIKTHPGALMFKDPNAPNIEPLLTGGNLPFGLEQANQKREFIKRCFYADWLKLEKEKVEMTAYETAERRDEKLRMLAPMLGRVQMELLNPLIGRSYALLDQLDKFPPAPTSLHNRRLRVEYISPAAKAQVGLKANEMSRYVQEILPVAQADPKVLDVVDFDQYAKHLALARSTPRVILRSQAQIAKVRAERAQQEQMAQLAQVAEPATKAIKNLADANESGFALGQNVGGA